MEKNFIEKVVTRLNFNSTLKIKSNKIRSLFSLFSITDTKDLFLAFCLVTTILIIYRNVFALPFIGDERESSRAKVRPDPAHR